MILLVNCGSIYFKKICLCLDKLHISYKTLKIENILKADLKKYNGIVISGSPLMLSELNKDERREYIKKFNFVKTCNVPVLGICYGHQAIGVLFGSEINHGKLIERDNTINIYDNTSLFKKFNKTAIFKEAHSDFMSLPDSFKLLANSDNCKVESMKHKSKNIFSVQFHPEISGKNGLMLFENFFSVIKKS